MKTNYYYLNPIFNYMYIHSFCKTKMANFLNISPQTLEKIFRQQKVRLNAIIKVVKKLKISINDILV